MEKHQLVTIAMLSENEKVVEVIISNIDQLKKLNKKQLIAGMVDRQDMIIKMSEKYDYDKSLIALEGTTISMPESEYFELIKMPNRLDAMTDKYEEVKKELILAQSMNTKALKHFLDKNETT